MTTEDKLNEMISFEDPDSMLQIAVTEDRQIVITDNEWRNNFIAPTLREAVDLMYADFTRSL